MSKAGRKAYGHYTDEQAVIEVIKLKSRLRKGAARPLGPWEIARELNDEGYKSQVGRAWSGIAVKRILERLSRPASPKKPAWEKKDHLDSSDYLTKQEVAACRAVLREGDRVLFETLLGAGLRASELCALEIRHLGLYRGHQQIDVKRGAKRGKKRAVKIGPRLRRVLRQYIQPRREASGSEPVFRNQKGEAMSYQNLYDAICVIRDRSGVNHVHPHVLRHTFASVLYHYKKDLEYVRKQLGHASIATTQIYVNVFSDTELEQMEGFERYFDLPKVPHRIGLK